MSYYNTTGVDAKTKAEYEAKAQHQEAEVLDFFNRFPGERFSPEDVHSRVMPTAPLTSARRAVTNLTKKGHLVRTAEQKIGKYGRPVGMWKLLLAPAAEPQTVAA